MLLYISVADPGVVQTNIMQEVPAILSCLAFSVLKRLRLLQSPQSGINSIIDAALAPPVSTLLVVLSEYWFYIYSTCHWCLNWPEVLYQPTHIHIIPSPVSMPCMIRFYLMQYVVPDALSFCDDNLSWAQLGNNILVNYLQEFLHTFD